MARQHDGWDVDSGLVDEARGLVTDAVFEVDAEYRDGDIPRLVLQVQTETDGELTFRYGTGPGWEIRDGGERVEHLTKDAFNKNTDMGKLVTSAVNAGARSLLAARGPATSATTWKGLFVGLERVEYKTKMDDEEITWDRMMLTEVADPNGGKSTPTKAAAEDNGEAEIKAQVQAIWDEVGEHGAFMERVFVEVPSVLLDPKLEQWVADANNWS